MKDNVLVSLETLSVKQIMPSESAEPLSGSFCHDRFEILYCVDAEGDITIEGKRFVLTPGSLVLINPFAYHKVDILSNGNIFGWSIQFAKNDLSDNTISLLEAILGDDDSSGRFFGDVSIGHIDGVFERFSIVETLPHERRMIYAQALLTELMVLMSVASGDSILHSGDCLGARVVRYLNKNIENNVSLDKLARRFFVSKYHLCRAFKEYSGISVHSYINHKRIMYARRLIESGETASGAAEKVGFGDYSAFYRAYIKIVGKSPTAN